MSIDTGKKTEVSIESPLAHLSEETIEQLAKEFDAIHDEVYADLGERDRNYITTVIAAQRQLAVAGRVILFGSKSRTAWVAGTACLGVAKILENMEIGHNVMHGQWDWMNDPDIHSSVWDWDTASTAEAWKHSHNYVHHTYTNIRGKDKDLGYEIMRIDPNQPWSPVYLAQPFYNLLLMAFFEWGVALHDLDIEAIRKGEKPMKDLLTDLRGIGTKARRQIVKDYIGWPAVSALAYGAVQVVSGGRVSGAGKSKLGARLRSLSSSKATNSVAKVLDKHGAGIERTFVATVTADFVANIIRNLWSHGIIFCGHFPDQAYTFSKEETENETRGGWYVRQLVGAANIEGSSLFHLMSGNLSYQVEHHLYPDMPSTRYKEVAPKIKDICERYQLPYNSGPLMKQWGSVQRTIIRLAFPGGKMAPKPGPYRGERVGGSSSKPSEAARFRNRVPAGHPDSGPEHNGGGVEAKLPPRGE
ncbi:MULTISPECIES: fatty acid desaturase family protein [Nocardiaceae]|jgi:linoleoyl-CoA desaturase|uniref:Linoleoyl-CoA desaturase n=1 Tax=Rhodococcoides corynebacterioides TaxID=53972 RepID=A0ABS2KY79_9NOCA|nr:MULTISPECIES: acyl-CoA desaturase [Rhodococcus]KQU28006.1 fatty acid desaturase [Rhodococcus sp. Leaf225]KQU46117.1 fatty acid desaturase [Rhodococcus sp. Leaf258]MBM7416883.1 linoleoyl-CoA desaturase [Rhodococcus corynebacterioides]MBP1115136.1 linoleoyl-CoA desaturase [Rhodococcus sp. PvP016]MBY6683492.1 acyl-CoA desaturase [Rhodococcus sp. BP-316]